MMAMVPPSTGQSNKLDVQETTAWYERRLRDGSNLKYRLTILQQPERARACGQGAKSHADRRPVDPPPVVELRLFHGEDQKDVTFSFNSNFFLFATLEPARPIANGRVVPTPAQAPVLTGVPVSGMAYLDRPAPAGYFIFPDLSVRHEGKYRLHFALFEECKEEGDRDAMSNGEVISFRVEVKSKPFTVFSAKKFPGLAESTSLSRIVAEQGCRVRIRRDVRMRRRAEKPSGGRDEEMMEETELRRREHVSQPQQPQQPVEKRERSDSNNAPAAAAPEYNRPSYERPSYSQPQPPSSAAPSNSHLSFSANQTSQSHIAPPPPAGAPQSWQSQQYERPQATQPSQPTSSTEYRRESGEYFKRRDSETYSQPPQPTPAQQPPQQAPYYSQSTPQSYSAPSPYAPPPSQSRSHRNSRDDLPPLKLAALEPRLGNGMNSPSSGTPNSEFIAQRSSSQSLPSPSTYGPPTSTPRSSTSAPSSGPSSYSGPPSYYPQHQQQSSSDWSYSASQKIVPAPEPAPRHAGAKRSWDRVFNDSHVRDRLQNGMRPSQNPTHYGIDADDDDDDEIDYTLMRMSYRRADGVQIVRALPDESD